MAGPVAVRESITVVTRSPRETRRVAAALGRAVEPVPHGGLVVSLVGDLGAGKTVFAGGLLEGLGVPAGTAVTSPTFTFAKGYRGRVPVHHVDAYMVRGPADLEASGFFELGQDLGRNGGVIAVEWGDRIAGSLPADRLEVEVDVVEATAASPSETRRIAIRALGPATAVILARFGRELERGSPTGAGAEPSP